TAAGVPRYRPELATQALGEAGVDAGGLPDGVRVRDEVGVRISAPERGVAEQVVAVPVRVHDPADRGELHVAKLANHALRDAGELPGIDDEGGIPSRDRHDVA